MNENSQPFGKISLHGDGMGVPSPEMVEKRAREIALIDERDPNDFTDADWKKAQRELLGKESIPTADDHDERTDGMIDRDEVPDEAGHRVPRVGFEDDDESLGAHLVEDGIGEAAHDQMVEAAREDQEQEG
ncbi:MAG: hypothetical protein M3Y86_00045 [Verrucomicrobiota bacterium]|nr:hypothetical protein [Verrucomicrobiota bacterium]